jgi:DNA-binding transcriptional MocR family regulator
VAGIARDPAGPENSPPLTQFVAQPDVIDLGWGHPDPDLLPIEELRLAADEAARRWGPDLYAYGYAQGPAPLIAWLAERLGDVDSRAPDQSSIVITAGASNALDMVVTLSTRPGEVALVESPTYHIATKLLRDHGLELVAVPRDAQGPDPEALAAILDKLEAAGRRPGLLYTIPTFHNPTGVVTPLERRVELVRFAESRGLLVVEDDAYRELFYGEPPPPSLWSLAEPGSVVRVGSFSKTLAPGLRLGYLTAEAGLTARMAQSGLLDSGGGIAHVPGLTVAVLAETGFYATHVDRLRASYGVRRDALLDGLASGLPDGAEATRPAGGFFVWLTLPARHSSVRVLELALEEGVSFMPGNAFSMTDGLDSSLRLSFSRYGPDQLREAARRIAAAIARAG